MDAALSAETDPDQVLTIGERLRQAREARGLSLDEVAGQTRIPVRHLQHIESGDWEALPAITYSIGFVRSYANAIGLDGSALGAELRQHLGGGRRTGAVADYYQPADPARVPPRWLAFAAAVIALLLIGGYLVFRSGIEDGSEVAARGTRAPAAEPPGAAQPQATPRPQNLAGQPVVLTALAPVWLRISEEGGGVFVERTLAAGESYQVPATAARPRLRVGAPEALRVTVGQTVVPQLGPAGQPIGNVSLRAEDLVALPPGSGAPQAGTQPPAR